jgi:hypothetical protein
MKRKSKYNIDEQWDDPFERQEERRKAERCVEEFKIKIGVEVEGHDKLLVGDGIVVNISQAGMLCRTKHNLKVGQEIQLAIPTKEYSTDKNFPLKFTGMGSINRTKAITDSVNEVGIFFKSELAQDMAFSIFIESLQSIASLKADL